MIEFNYSNSDHNTTVPAEAPAAAAPVPGAPVFEYENTNPSDPVQLDIPQNVRELRASDPDRQLLPQGAQSAYAEVIKDDPSATPEQRAVAYECREILGDLGLDNTQARTLVDTIVGLTEIPSEQQQAQWGAQTRQELYRQFGNSTEERIALAQKLVARDPRVRQILVSAGLANHPQVVKMFVEKAWTLRGQGKLR